MTTMKKMEENKTTDWWKTEEDKCLLKVVVEKEVVGYV
jgi:hypothetical protein